MRKIQNSNSQAKDFQEVEYKILLKRFLFISKYIDIIKHISSITNVENLKYYLIIIIWYDNSKKDEEEKYMNYKIYE